MDYDTRDIVPEEYRNREERPKRRGFDRPANGEERKIHQWRDDSQTAPCSTAKR
ncbi:MAG: hypothetical protein IIZ06_05445 [Kiritimatiellae bacterium]|nr:hypothetical protein [Kiritimatiellia bacterium]